MVLKNQIIAREAVLDYKGKLILKSWDNLKRYIGKKIRVTLEHPGIDQLTKRFKKGTEVSHTTIQKCPTSNALCADLPEHNKTGYSIGYEYEELPAYGKVRGIPYEARREVTNIDHIALVASPRDSSLIKIAGDSTDTIVFQDGECYVNIYPLLGIGIDSYIFTKVTNMPTIEELTAALEAANTKNTQLAGDNKKYQAMAKSNLEKEVLSAVDALTNRHKIDPTKLDKRTPEFIKGALWGADSVFKKYEEASGAELLSGSTGKDELDYDGYVDVNDLVLKDGKLAMPDKS